MQVDGITAPIEELATLAITSAESPFKTNNQATNTAFNAPPPAIANNAAPPATIPKPGAVPANLAALAAEHPRPYVPDWDAVHEAYQAWEGETQPTQAYDPHIDAPIFSPEGSNGGGEEGHDVEVESATPVGSEWSVVSDGSGDWDSEDDINELYPLPESVPDPQGRMELYRRWWEGLVIGGWCDYCSSEAVILRPLRDFASGLYLKACCECGNREEVDMYGLVPECKDAYTQTCDQDMLALSRGDRLMGVRNTARLGPRWGM